VKLRCLLRRIGIKIHVFIHGVLLLVQTPGNTEETLLCVRVRCCLRDSGKGS
jgi:hypothetical protein